MQDGSLQKSLKAVETKTQSQVAVESALQSLAKGSELEQVVQDVGDKAAMLAEPQDVTAQFLMPVEKETDLEESPIFVYKGIIKRLASMQGKLSDGTPEVGVLAGKEMRVLDVITGPSVSAVTGNQSVIERWERLEYSTMGIVVWNHSGSPDECSKHFEGLDTSVSMLLIAFPLATDRRGWTLKQCDGTLKFSPVRVESSKATNRKKNDVYMVLKANKVSTTLKDEAGSIFIQQCNASYCILFHVVCNICYQGYIAYGLQAVLSANALNQRLSN